MQVPHRNHEVKKIVYKVPNDVAESLLSANHLVNLHWSDPACRHLPLIWVLLMAITYYIISIHADQQNTVHKPEGR
jgi:hypothetical protein